MNASVYFTLNATISVVMNAVAMKRKQKVAFFSSIQLIKYGNLHMECRLKNGDVIMSPSLTDFEEAFKNKNGNLKELTEEMKFYLDNVWWTETFGEGEHIREVLLDTKEKIKKRMKEHPDKKEALKVVVDMIDERICILNE